MSQTQQTQQGQISIPDAGALGSIQQLLANNLGKDVVAEFVVGLDEQVQKTGVLTAVRNDYLVLFDDVRLVDIVCDIYSLKFITFYLPGTRPGTGGTAADRAQPEARETPTAALAALNYAKRKARKLD